MPNSRALLLSCLALIAAIAVRADKPLSTAYASLETTLDESASALEMPTLGAAQAPSASARLSVQDPIVLPPERQRELEALIELHRRDPDEKRGLLASLIRDAAWEAEVHSPRCSPSGVDRGMNGCEMFYWWLLAMERQLWEMSLRSPERAVSEHKRWIDRLQRRGAITRAEKDRRKRALESVLTVYEVNSYVNLLPSAMEQGLGQREVEYIFSTRRNRDQMIELVRSESQKVARFSFEEGNDLIRVYLRHAAGMPDRSTVP